MQPKSNIRSSGRPSRKRETGQTVAEYALVTSMVTVVVVAVLVILSGDGYRAIERVTGLIPG